jgi:hypothetical protein
LADRQAEAGGEKFDDEFAVARSAGPKAAGGRSNGANGASVQVIVTEPDRHGGSLMSPAWGQQEDCHSIGRGACRQGSRER